MEIVGKTKYLKNIKEEFKSGKEAAQLYLLVYSFLLPHLLSTISQTSAEINQDGLNISTQVFQGGLIGLLCLFILSIGQYYLKLTKIRDFMSFKVREVNRLAIFAALAFGFTLAMDVSLNLPLPQTTDGMPIQFVLFVSFGRLFRYHVIGLLLTGVVARSLIITSIPEKSINPVADELKNARYDQIDEIRDLIGYDYFSTLILMITFMFVIGGLLPN
jgi:hypothetical protein